VLIDYVVEFAQLQISPRLLSLPLPRAQWSQANLGQTAAAVTPAFQFAMVVGGNGLNGLASVIPVGCAAGDLYKVFFDITNSAPAGWTNITAATGIAVAEFGGTTVVPLVDGTTMYAQYNGTSFEFIPNSASLYSGGGSDMRYNVTATVTYNIQCWLSLVGTLSATNLNPNY